MIGHNSPRPPKVMVPRQISETKRPVRPNGLYFIAIRSWQFDPGGRVIFSATDVADCRLQARPRKAATLFGKIQARSAFRKYAGELAFFYFAGALASSLRNSVCVSGRENIG